jgi:hypothetical protein
MSSKINTTYVSSAVGGPYRWESRITVIEETEKGLKFRREHSMHNGETMFLDWKSLESSHWVEEEYINEFRI